MTNLPITPEERTLLSVLLFLSYFLLLFIFFVCVLLRMDMFSKIMLFLLISWSSIVPFLVVFLEERKDETKKNQLPGKQQKKPS
ncbi:hypothetical protein [Sporolactobacillus pectinivorans]|uniref:hypothetical protein n=1 Tax=Sporolactobacillus pectinivorans TaxID=1591408 RepID=UPI0012FD6C19|nr:hypothetical protein [Sporolactobacillus pectinivorans]